MRLPVPTWGVLGATPSFLSLRDHVFQVAHGSGLTDDLVLLVPNDSSVRIVRGRDPKDFVFHFLPQSSLLRQAQRVHRVVDSVLRASQVLFEACLTELLPISVGEPRVRSLLEHWEVIESRGASGSLGHGPCLIEAISCHIA